MYKEKDSGGKSAFRAKILISVIVVLAMLIVPLQSFAQQSETANTPDVPKITFTTENGSGTSLKKSDGYVNATVKIEDTDGTSSTDSVVMKVRGNSTAFDSIAKKSYNFKFSKKQNVLNMGSGKKWALISNIYDPTLARNYIAFSLAKELGIRYTSEFKVVEVMVDGSFRGCYLLIEPVGDGADRVDIDVKGNGGKKDFLLELEASREEDDVTYFTSNGIRFAVSEPEEPTEEQLSYIQSVTDDIISTIKTGTKEEIESKIDVESFVKFYLLNEFLKTVDFNFSSLFYYCKDGKLCAGPPWDYDLSSGNVNEEFSSRYASSYKTDGLFISNYNLYRWLCAKDWFNDLVREEFSQRYPYFASIPAEGGVIDSFYKTYEKVINRNFKDAGWRVNAYYVNVMKRPLATYRENYDFYVNWCKERVEWLREYFGVEPITEPTTEPTETASETVPTESSDEPAVTEPTEMTPEPTSPAVNPPAKKKNPVIITAKNKTVKLKSIKKKTQSFKAITVKNSKGKVSCRLKSVSKKLKKFLRISSKGVVTFKKWTKAKAGTYRIKVTITAKGNTKYKSKTVTKTVKIKVK